jgi:hypothetical protein
MEAVDSLKQTDSYPNFSYHLFCFSDCEGYIGPKAMKELSQYLTEVDALKKMKNISDEYDRNTAIALIKCIHKTASVDDGYLLF